MAQGVEPTRLQCDGTYNFYRDSRLRDLSVRGMVVTILNGKLSLEGSISFDGEYIISNQAEHGLGLVAQSNRRFTGFLHRYGGQLSLGEKDDSTPDGPLRMLQTLTAICQKATPLF